MLNTKQHSILKWDLHIFINNKYGNFLFCLLLQGTKAEGVGEWGGITLTIQNAQPIRMKTLRVTRVDNWHIHCTITGKKQKVIVEIYCFLNGQ